MTPIRVFGLSVLIFFLISCQTIKKSEICQQNRFFYSNYQPQFHYKNDSLKLGTIFYHFTSVEDKTNTQSYKLNAQQFVPFKRKELSLIGYFEDYTYKKYPFGIVFYQVRRNIIKNSQKKWVSYTSPNSKIETQYFDTIFKNKNIFSRTFVFQLNTNSVALQIFGKAENANYKNYSYELIDSLHIGKEYEKVYNNSLFDTAMAILKTEDSLPCYFYFKELYEKNNSYYKSPEDPEKFIRANMLRYAYSFYHQLDKISQYQIEFQHQEHTNLTASPLQSTIKKSISKKILNSIASLINNNEEDSKKMFSDIKDASVVIINENHNDWRHRYHTTSLLDTLYKLGYHSIGIEAIFNNDSIEFKKYPSLNTGFYTLEPAMANLIRKVKTDKWNLFSYDYDKDKYDTISKKYPTISGREWSEAIHIMDFIKNHPNEKVLIHCGFSHLFENNSQNGKMWLAEILKKFWNVNPVTIDQFYFDDIEVKDMPINKESSPFVYYSKQRFLPYEMSKFNQADYYSITNIAYDDYCTNESYNARGISIPLKSILDSLNCRADCSVEIYPLKEVEDKNFLPCYLYWYSHISKEAPKNIFLPTGSYILCIRSIRNHILLSRKF